MADITAERIAKNDAAFRAANEQIRQRAEEIGLDERIPFLCECAREDCTEIVRLTPEAYEAIRASPRRFFSARGHEGDAGAAEVVREEEGYAVVEKRGRAAEVVEELDPREED